MILIADSLVTPNEGVQHIVVWVAWNRNLVSGISAPAQPGMNLRKSSLSTELFIYANFYSKYSYIYI